MAARPATIDYNDSPVARRSAASMSRAFGDQVRTVQFRTGAAQDLGNSVRSLKPRDTTLPLWLRQLIVLQRGSSMAVLVMGGLTLLAYSWTVHSQRSWSQAYAHLSHLRRNEPQLTRANEVLKEHLAQQAELANSGLIEPTPGHMLYLEPAELRPSRPVPPPEVPAAIDAPLGY